MRIRRKSYEGTLVPVARPARLCNVCGRKPVAWTRSRTGHCYSCMPDGPFAPPPCVRCGSAEYYSDGYCLPCHEAARLYPVGCRDCEAWGLPRLKKSHLCETCQGRRKERGPARCRACGRGDVAVSKEQYCNLCAKQAVIELGLSVEEAAAGSQQTFIVNLDWPLTKRVAPDSTVRERYLRVEPGQDRRRRPVATGAAFHPVPYQQLTLLEMPRDLARAKSRGWLPQAPIRAMEACLDEALDEHARQHGWPDYRVAYTRRALRTLQAIQDTPGAMLRASDVAQLRVIGLPVESTIMGPTPGSWTRGVITRRSAA